MTTIKKKQFICPACGFPELTEDPMEQTYEICPSCGMEFGYADAQYHATGDVGVYRNWREQWIRGGMKWVHKDKDSLEEKPKDWNPKEQLKNIPEEYR